MNYYDEKIYIAAVDKNDKVLKPIERWEAHKAGVLHRAFTVCLYFEGKILLQHRKHPVFDDVFDLTCSSHPVFYRDHIQDTKNAVYETLVREWDVSKKDLISEIVHKGYIYYKVKDPKSIYIEHEICHLYTAHINRLPFPNSEYAYGYTVMKKEMFSKKASTMYRYLAPWVIKLLSILD